MGNTPDILKQAMAARAGRGLYAAVDPRDAEAFKAAGGGVLSIYAKDRDQFDRYCAGVTRLGARLVFTRE